MSADQPKYTISTAAKLVGMHPQTLRMYEARGLIRPGRTPGGTRLYADRDIERLQTIQRLTTELGLNLEGVRRVIALQDELDALRLRMRRLEQRMHEEVERVHRHYRRELVVYRAEGQGGGRLPQRRRG
jgi:MerR family transcriptional regulator/heat shock protein HspR